MQIPLSLPTMASLIADILKQFDSERPMHKAFHPGIGPFGEPQIVTVIAERLQALDVPARTRRNPDLLIPDYWAMEFKIARPFGDNGKEAEDWSVNLLHPYPGNVSLLGDGLKLAAWPGSEKRALLVIGYEHEVARINLDPLIESFEAIAQQVMHIPLSRRVEERRDTLVHPVHQVLRCIAWEVQAR